MLTPKEAYDIFIKEFSETKRSQIADCGSFYSCSPVAIGDMSEECYKIDKETGKITYWDYEDYLEYARSLPEDYYPKIYKIK